MRRFIVLDDNNVVVTVRLGTEAVGDEIESDTGDCGQIMQQDGSFIWPEPPAPTPTLEDKVNYLYYKSRGVI